MLTRYILAFLLVTITGTGFSQQKNDYKGDSEFDLKNYKNDPHDRIIFELNYTNWLNAPEAIKSDWKCIGINFSLMFDKPIKHSHFSIGYGLGIYTHNYSSNAGFIYQLDSTNNKVQTLLEPRKDSYSANRYNEKSVEIPLEIRFRSKTEHMFKMMLGAKIGYVFSNYKKTDDADGVVRRYNIKNINPLRYGVHFRIGVEQISLTACYYLSEIFNENGAKGIHPFSVGLAIIPY